MTLTIPFSFLRFLYNNTNYNGRKYTKKVVIKSIISYFYGYSPEEFLKIKKQNVSIIYKKAYGHLLEFKPKGVPVAKYLLFIAGYKKCKYADKIFKLQEFESCDKTWDGYKDYTTIGISIRYNFNKKETKEYRQWYQKENADVIARISAKRRARKVKATPKWLTEEHFTMINNFYKEAKSLSSDACKYHVDHIVPLQGKDVCGLHVPWNLQILPASENLKKSNKIIT